MRGRLISRKIGESAKRCRHNNARTNLACDRALGMIDQQRGAIVCFSLIPNPTNHANEMRLDAVCYTGHVIGGHFRTIQINTIGCLFGRATSLGDRRLLTLLDVVAVALDAGIASCLSGMACSTGGTLHRQEFVRVAFVGIRLFGECCKRNWILRIVFVHSVAMNAIHETGHV